MDLRQLEYFVRVAELGSFTRAAIELGVAQPALSRQVRQLEVELRQNLLVRNGRGAVPTEAGQLLLEHGRGILHQVAVAREELGATRGALAGRVSIGLPPSLSRLITVPLTQAFRAQLPGALLTLTEGFSLQMYEALRVGKIDMAVLYNPERSSELEAQLLHEEELVLISHSAASSAVTRAARKAAAPDAQLPDVRLRDVASLPLILPSRPNAFRLLVESQLRTLGHAPQIAMEVDGLNAILNLVQDGLGHAVLPRYTLSNFDSPHPFSVRRIRSPRILSQLMLARSSRRPATETQHHAAALVRQVVAEQLRPWT
ncbi:MAG: LysR substrate-binding domain-containing protein [Burkholderiaceae bacterium]